MGWDNLSTIAGEVEAPQRTYSRAMLGAVVLVVASYLLPVAAVAHIGLDPNSWTTGGWVDVGRIVGGQTLAIRDHARGSDRRDRIVRRADDVVHAAARGDGRGRLSSEHFRPAGTLAPAHRGLRLSLARYSGRCAIRSDSSGACILDVLLTGLSILLEFWALVALRIREPNLARPYRVPGGTFGAILIGLPPLALIVTALVRNSKESVGSTNELVIGAAVVAAGIAMYFFTRIFQRKKAA